MLDIDDGILEYTEQMNETLIRNAREYILHKEQGMPDNLRASMLPEGTRVRHNYLGEGTVIKSDLDRAAYEILFDGIATPRTISVRVKLTRL